MVNGICAASFCVCDSKHPVSVHRCSHSKNGTTKEVLEDLRSVCLCVCVSVYMWMIEKELKDLNLMKPERASLGHISPQNQRNRKLFLLKENEACFRVIKILYAM